jgi:hypothetical protein
MSTTYAKHESFKQVTLFYEQVALVTHTWPQIINNLVHLKTKYNTIENLLEDTNN